MSAVEPAVPAVHDDEVVLTGVVGWRPRLGDPADDLAALPEAVRAGLG